MTADTVSKRLREHTLGWIGTGRMGTALVTRLLERGCDVTIYNRTRSKAEPLARLGARIVDRPADLSDREIVITSVAGSDDFAEVITGPEGLLSNGGRVPGIVIDSSTVSMDVSESVRGKAGRLGTALLAPPVPGNPKVPRSRRLSLAAVGDRPPDSRDTDRQRAGRSRLRGLARAGGPGRELQAGAGSASSRGRPRGSPSGRTRWQGLSSRSPRCPPRAGCMSIGRNASTSAACMTIAFAGPERLLPAPGWARSSSST